MFPIMMFFFLQNKSINQSSITTTLTATAATTFTITTTKTKLKLEIINGKKILVSLWILFKKSRNLRPVNYVVLFHVFFLSITCRWHRPRKFHLEVNVAGFEWLWLCTEYTSSLQNSQMCLILINAFAINL